MSRVGVGMARSMRITLLAAGIFAVLIGLIWIGQGTGYFPYPSSSFMIDQAPWIYRGAVLVVLGVLAAVISRWI
jgi:hypothetical protein